MKNFLLVLFLIVSSENAFGQWYWGSKDSKDTAINLTKRISPDQDLKSIEFGTVDPSSVATNASQGSLFLTASNTFIKLDNGSTTNWRPLTALSSGTAGQFLQSTGTSSPTWNDLGFQNVVYVATNGNNTNCVANAINRPCLTVAHALTLVSAPSTANRWVIKVGVGTFVETVAVNLTPWTWIVGEAGAQMGGASRINNTATNTIGLDASWSTGGQRGGLQNVYLTGSTGLSFDRQAIAGVGSVTLEVYNVGINGAVNLLGTSTLDFWDFVGVRAFGAQTVSGGAYSVRNSYIVNSVTFNNAGAVDLDAAFESTKIENNLSATQSGANTLNILFTASAVQGTVTKTGTVTTNSTGIFYEPLTPGDWSPAPNDVDEALDQLAARPAVPVLAANSGLRTNGTGDFEAVTQTNGQILIGSTGTTPQVATITGTANQVAVTNGAGSITLSTPQDIATSSSPTFSGLTVSGLSASSPVRTNGSSALTTGQTSLTTEVTGILPVSNGGTGASSLTSNNVILGNGTSAVSFVAPSTSGNTLTSNGTTWVSSAALGCRIAASVQWDNTANCTWTSSAAGFSDFGADVDCDDNARTVYGYLNATSGSAGNSDGQQPLIKLTSMPIGDYVLTYEGFFQHNTSGAQHFLRASNGTTQTSVQAHYFDGGSAMVSNVQVFNYRETTGAGATTWQLQYSNNGGGGSTDIQANSSPRRLKISVMYCPLL